MSFGELLDVLVAREPQGGELEVAEPEVVVLVLDLDDLEVAVLRLRDDHEVEQAHQPGLDEVGQRAEHAGGGAVPLEPDEIELDGAVLEISHSVSFLLRRPRSRAPGGLEACDPLADQHDADHEQQHGHDGRVVVHEPRAQRLERSRHPLRRDEVGDHRDRDGCRRRSAVKTHDRDDDRAAASARRRRSRHPRRPPSAGSSG